MKAQGAQVRRIAAELARQVRDWVERTAERAREYFAPPEPELAGARGYGEPSDDLADRLREADREGASFERGGGGDAGLDRSGPEEGDEEAEDTRDLAERLREAARDIDYDTALERMQGLQREREEYEKGLCDEQAKNCDEERRYLERERERETATAVGGDRDGF